MEEPWIRPGYRATVFRFLTSTKRSLYGNAWTERLMRRFKQAEVNLENHGTYCDVIEDLPRFIEEVYNEKRGYS